MKLQLKLSFAEGEIDEPSIAFGSGWADPEAVGRWALEGESLLHLPALAAASDFDLKLTVWPMLVPGLVTAQRVSAQFNGVEVGSAVVSRQEPTGCGSSCLERRAAATDRTAFGCVIPTPPLRRITRAAAPIRASSDCSTSRAFYRAPGARGRWRGRIGCCSW